MQRSLLVGMVALLLGGCSAAGSDDGVVALDTGPGGADSASDGGGGGDGSDDGGGGGDTDPTVDSTPPPADADGGGGTDTGAAGDGAPPPSPICLGKTAGKYCGNDEMKDADPDTLYDCPGPGKPPTSSTKCPAGCLVAPAGTADSCKVPVSPGSYRLPWNAGVTMSLTQDCNDSCCSDHIGVDQWAWDWANGTGFTVVAARGGTITHLKINSTSGCGSSSCANDANILVIDHGDGTQALYMHLKGGSLKPGISCGATVTSGQELAIAGTTGWSTGIHLHFQVGKVHTGAATCECGAAGTGCSASTVPWSTVWVTTTYPTIPITFTQWPTADKCANRRITMPPA